MTGVPAGEFPVRSWLYKSLPLNDRATVLMLGRFEDQKPHEPVAWTHVRPDGGRVFYTSLGHPDDFGIPAFTRLLQNGIYFAANLPVPPAEAAAAK
jgi:type 1 glutamine amidotransferase